jgi:mutator protein MutT
MTKPLCTTVLLIVRDDQILLAMKKRGFGAGKWNGPGGKVEAGETSKAACIRECQEEINVTPSNLHHVATLNFELRQTNEVVTSDIYMCSDFEGTPEETAEMRPQWFNISSIPFNDMWQDDIYWLPAIISGRKLKGTFVFDTDEKLISAQITERTQL